MSTMKEMAAEYREAAAKLAMKIQELEASGAPPKDIEALRTILKNIRAEARVLSSYYEAPRTPDGGGAVGWHARRINDAKH